MYKAEHNKMFQEANQGLIEIRQAEIDYYMRVNSALGTQGSLILGFAYLTFTQNLDYDYPWSYYFEVIYFCSTALCMAFAIHVVLTTMLVQLLGPGLALNGPIGSMARAAEGMRIEQDQVMRAFFTMMFFFSTSTLLLFWVAMPMYASIISTSVYVVAARYWLYYCNRIYLRFFWDRSVKAGNFKEDQQRNSSLDEPVVPLQLQNPLHNVDIEEGGAASDVHERPSFFSGRASNRESFVDRVSNTVGHIVGLKKGGHSETGKQMQPQRPSFTVNNPKEVLVEGFITMNTVSELKPKHWERRYIVLNYNGQLVYYKSRQDFRTEPINSRLNPRPLSLDEFYVSFTKYENSDSASIASSIEETMGVSKFMFSLSRKDDENFRHWHYKTDTEEELDMWVNALKLVSPSSFK